MFEYKSGGYTRRLQRIFVLIALAVAIGLALGLGLSGAVRTPPQFNNIY